MEDINDEYDVRLKKRQDLINKNINPYNSKFDKKHSTSDIRIKIEEGNLRSVDEIGLDPRSDFKVAGRIVSMRNHGKIIFFDLRDAEGDIQVCVREDILKEEAFKIILEYVDVGDFVGAEGELFETNRKTFALCINNLVILSKTIRPFPTEHFGIEDEEVLRRKRYLDLAINEKTRERFRIKETAIRELRKWLEDKGFREISTRTLESVPGGASARPFITHHNHLDEDFYLRISLEIDLKMAIASGYERIFEMGKVFRNEGIDADHLQEFTLLEWYAAYHNYQDGMEWTEDLLSSVTRKAKGNEDGYVFIGEEVKKVSLSPPYKRITFEKLLQDEGINIRGGRDEIESMYCDLGHGKDDAEKLSIGSMLDTIYKRKVRHKIIEPTFVTNYPAMLFPLAKASDDDVFVSDSYQLVIGGIEIVKGYSELVDPVKQREFFKEQESARVKGDNDAMFFNEEFLVAMEHGMPPMTGWGMGIERFIALIAPSKNLKDVSLFPLYSPKK